MTIQYIMTSNHIQLQVNQVRLQTDTAMLVLHNNLLGVGLREEETS